MATFTAVKCGTQSGGAMGRALNYVKKDRKTLWGDRELVTGWNCVAQSAYDEMMLTKQRYNKTDGMMFYHFVQSFDPKEDVTPEEVHAIGLELAQKLFPEYEVVVATHTDTEHLHSHLIVNSVSFETGRKLHQNAADLQRQRQISDEFCRAHGLTVLEALPRHAQKKKMNNREYRSAAKGESWKLRLMIAIDQCMRTARTRDEFIREMERQGYQVRWEAGRKSITYTTPAGKKCRDDRLHDEKYLKEVMEHEFRIRKALLTGGAEAAEYAAGAHTGSDARSAGVTSDGGGVGNHDERSVRAVPSGGRPVQSAGATGSDAGESSGAGAAGDADSGGKADSDAGRTGWEEERETVLSAETAAARLGPARAIPGMAAGHPDLGGVVGAAARLVHALDRDQGAAPVRDATTAFQHSDRKALAREREKKIAMGHRADDHEEQRFQQSM